MRASLAAAVLSALLAPGCFADEELASEEKACAGDAWWRRVFVGGARATPPEPIHETRFESDAWERWHRANPPPPSDPCATATPRLESDVLPPERWHGPILAPGERDVLQLVVASASAFPLEDWTVRLDVPDGVRLVEGDPEWQGDVPPEGLLLVWVVEMTRAGYWTVMATGGPPDWGNPHHTVAYRVET